jgi:crotonobetainyl-CoA:carnitine CoA-transferase CaiB-like acyl-CoA transferase
LYARPSLGSGQYLDLGQLQMAASLFGETQLAWIANRQNVMRNGNYEVGPLVHDVFACLGHDSWCAVVVWPDDIPRLEGVIGIPRGEQTSAESIQRAVQQWISVRPAQEAMAQLQAAGVEAGAVQNSADLIEQDVHLRARGFFEDVPDVFGESLEMEAVPFILGAADRRLTRTGPMLGGDNDYVFRSVLGLSPEEFRNLREQGVIPG